MLTAKQIERGSGRNRPDVHLIFRGTDVVGMLERFKGSGNPWHAYREVGTDRVHVGAFYPAHHGSAARAKEQAMLEIVEAPRAR